MATLGAPSVGLLSQAPRRFVWMDQVITVLIANRRNWYAVALVMVALTFAFQSSIWFWLIQVVLAILGAGWSLGKSLAEDERPPGRLFGSSELAFGICTVAAVGDSLILAHLAGAL